MISWCKIFIASSSKRKDKQFAVCLGFFSPGQVSISVFQNKKAQVSSRTNLFKYFLSILRLMCFITLVLMAFLDIYISFNNGFQLLSVIVNWL
jgi:hypothetical protein